MKYYKLFKILNVVSSIIIAALAVYIIFQPFMPNIIFGLTSNEFQGYVFQSEKAKQVLGEKAMQLPLIPIENRIVIPKIFVNSLITEGYNESALNYGMWRRPNTSTPDTGGNTVITSHRFLHTTGPNTLFHLDKAAVDDVILVYWRGKEYVYKIFEIFEVYPEQIEVENNTKDSIITLYTCTPLWTAEKRLVVKAKLQ